MNCVRCEKEGRATVTSLNTGKSVKLCTGCFVDLLSEGTDNPEVPGPIHREVFALIEKTSDDEALLRLDTNLPGGAS